MQSPVPQNLTTAIAATWPLLLGFALIMLGGGLQGTLLGLRATIEEFPAAATGLIMSAYYVGFLLGSLVTVRLVARVGHIRVFAALTSMASMLILVHAVAVDAVVWGLLRLLSGICFAGIYIVAESWLNDRATNQTRGQVFAVYMMINFAGLGFGQFLLNVADPLDPTLFMLVSILVSLAAVPLVLSSRQGPMFSRPSKLRWAAVYRSSPMAVGGALSSGLASGAVFGMGAVYAVSIGLSIPQTALFVAMPIFGAMLLQWPLGWLSDRIDRRVVIVLAACLSLVAAGLTLSVAAAIPWLFFPLMMLLGGTSLPVYGLAASHLNDQLEPDDMVAASSTLILLSGVGAALGPVLAGAMMGGIGASGFLWFFVLVNAMLLVYTVLRMRLHRQLEDLTKRRWVLLRPAATPLAAGAATESRVDEVIEVAGVDGAGNGQGDTEASDSGR